MNQGTGEDEDEDEDERNSKMNEISEEDRRKIEKMYYRMRRYTCQYCPIRFNDKMKLAMHEGVHLQSKKPVMCPYCDKTYSRRDKLREHIDRSHEGLPMPDPSPKKPEMFGHPYADSASPAASPRRPKYSAEEFEEADGQYKCPECPTMWSDIPEAQKHVEKVHTSRPARCKICFMSYNDKRGLYQHMSRKHPKNPERSQIANPFVMSNLNQTPGAYSSPDGDDAEPTPNLQPIKMADGTIRCPLCPKTYTSLGGFYIHKKNHHSRSASHTPDNKKKFWCEVCGKYYSSYTSLYIHRKNLHPMESPKPSSTNGPILMTRHQPIAPKPSALVVNVGSGSTHACLKCDGKFSSLKLLALHIEDFHQGTQSSGEDGVSPKLVDCPYCNSAYPRKDKLNVHIKNTHPGQPLVGEDKSSPVKILPRPSENGDSNSSNALLDDSFTRKMKYKEKCFKCTHCGKGYVDAIRLKQHIDHRHTKHNDPFRDVEPNSDIVVRNSSSRLGYDVCKVLLVYNSGLRLKCAKFDEPSSEDSDIWLLTEKIDKNITKRDIIMILTTMRRFDKRQYKMDPNEFIKMTKTVNANMAGSKENSNDGSSQDGIKTEVGTVKLEPPAVASGSLQISAVVKKEGAMPKVEGLKKEEEGEDDEIEDDLDDEDEERFIARLT